MGLNYHYSSALVFPTLGPHPLGSPILPCLPCPRLNITAADLCFPKAQLKVLLMLINSLNFVDRNWQLELVLGWAHRTRQLWRLDFVVSGFIISQGPQWFVFEVGVSVHAAFPGVRLRLVLLSAGSPVASRFKAFPSVPWGTIKQFFLLFWAEEQLILFLVLSFPKSC